MFDKLTAKMYQPADANEEKQFNLFLLDSGWGYLLEKGRAEAKCPRCHSGKSIRYKFVNIETGYPYSGLTLSMLLDIY